MSQLKSEFDTPDSSPGFLLWQLTNKWQAAQRHALAPFGLTHVQFVLLASLAWLGLSPLTQKELAKHVSIDIMMTSQVLRALEKKGLVVRSADPKDKRAINVKASKEGIELVNRAIKAVEQVDKDFFNALGKDKPEFTNLLLLLNRSRE
jgi:DNA-binding MarR family transcriptional regulator